MSYLFTQTGRNIRQTLGAQLMTLLTVSLSVLIFAFFYLIYINIMHAETKTSKDIRLVLFLDQELSDEDRTALEQKIREFDDVDRIIYVSKQEAFSRLKKQLGDEKDVLNDLDSSFLPASIEVFPSKNFNSLVNLKNFSDYLATLPGTDKVQYCKIAESFEPAMPVLHFSDYLATLPGADKVQYGHGWLERFSNFADLARIIVIISGSLLILTTLFMVSYTIRLTVVARQKELEILRFMGASSSYIRGPLFIEGFIQGAVGSALGLTGLYFLFEWIQSRFSGPGLLNLFSFTFFPPETVAFIVLASVTLCTCGSSVTMRRFLRL